MQCMPGISTQHPSNKSSHRRCSVKKGVLKNFTKFTGRHLGKRLFFNKKGTLYIKWLKYVNAADSRGSTTPKVKIIKKHQ